MLSRKANNISLTKIKSAVQRRWLVSLDSRHTTFCYIMRRWQRQRMTQKYDEQSRKFSMQPQLVMEIDATSVCRVSNIQQQCSTKTSYERNTFWSDRFCAAFAENEMRKMKKKSKEESSSRASALTKCNSIRTNSHFGCAVKLSQIIIFVSTSYLGYVFGRCCRVSDACPMRVIHSSYSLGYCCCMLPDTKRYELSCQCVTCQCHTPLCVLFGLCCGMVGYVRR